MEAEELPTAACCRVAIGNVSKYTGIKDFKKQLVKWGVSGFQKVVKVANQPVAFVTFDSEESTNAATAKLAGITGADKTSPVTVAPAPEGKKRDRDENDHDRPNKRARQNNNNDKANIDGGEVAARTIMDQVTPLWQTPYPDQVVKKHALLTAILENLKRQCRNETRDASPPWLRRPKPAVLCELSEVVASPVIDGYRNKCEFTIGIGGDGSVEVGFLQGSFAEGVFHTVVKKQTNENKIFTQRHAI
eukprot:c9564_g1_i2.p1 GENE.c9564_g1_i2~~c9564_g1_i2.p1  ORF type:complete len:254 (+),score=62.14 c9564_g1_i2:22-762(+)